jgi:TonB family protein
VLRLARGSVDSIVAHEREHVRARDPWLVHLAAGATVVMPWHPVVWWMTMRLRLAVEFDCDARVLARCENAAERAAYAELLLAIASRVSPATGLAVPALIESSSTLSRRIAAMFPGAVRFVRTKSVVATLIAAALAITACNAPAPSSNDEGAGVSGPVGPEPTVARPPAAQPEAAPTTHVSSEQPVPPATAPSTARETTPAGAPTVHRPGPGVINPVPIRQIRPTYTPGAMRRKVQGSVQLEAVVDREGRVRDVKVLKSLDAELDENALKAAREWTFHPGARDGQPVDVAVMLELQFTIH